jgi:hypothetical protein
MRPRLNHSPLFTSLLIVLPLIVGILLIATPYFDTNDDAWLMLFVSGRVVNSTPSGEVYWLHPFLSHALAALYRLPAEVPWYGVMHIGGLVLAFWMMLYALFLKECSWRPLTLFLLCLLSFGFPSVLSLQFTKTAFLVGLGGVFLCTVTLQQSFAQPGLSRLTLSRLIGGLLMLILALMIRRKSLYLVGLVSLPVLGFLAWTAWKSQALRWFLTVATSFSLLLFALASVHTHVWARSPEWSRFDRVLQLKSALVDYQQVPYNTQTEPFFREVGWSANDYACLQHWLYLDAEVYSPEKLHALLARFPATVRSRANLHHALLVLRAHFDADGIAWLLLPLWASILLLGVHRRPRVLTSLAVGVGVLVAMFLLALFFHLPDRVFHPLVTSVCWFSLVLYEGHPSTGARLARARQWGGFGCMGITLLVLLTRADTSLVKILTFSVMTRQTNADLRAALVHLNPQPSQTFVVVGAAFPYEAILPLERQEYLRNLRILSLGPSNQSPMQQRMLGAQGIGDLHRALFEQPDVFLILSPERGEDILVERYLAEHYQVAVTITPYWHEGPLRVGKVTRHREPVETAP